MATPLLLPAQASALPVDESTWFARVEGDVSVSEDITWWHLVVTKLTGTPCVYAKVTFDLNNYPDRHVRLPNACAGKPSVSNGSRILVFMRGARVALCQDISWGRDRCTEVRYIPED